jgi:hypothetical protein
MPGLAQPRNRLTAQPDADEVGGRSRAQAVQVVFEKGDIASVLGDAVAQNQRPLSRDRGAVGGAGGREHQAGQDEGCDPGAETAEEREHNKGEAEIMKREG